MFNVHNFEITVRTEQETKKQSLIYESLFYYISRTGNIKIKCAAIMQKQYGSIAKKFFFG